MSGDRRRAVASLESGASTRAARAARPPWRTVRKPSMTSGGSLERLARVFLRMRVPSRQAWRSRMAGILERLGMLSMWKDTTSVMGTKCQLQYSRDETKSCEINGLSANQPS